jgi:hypothetical protein
MDDWHREAEGSGLKNRTWESQARVRIPHHPPRYFSRDKIGYQDKSAFIAVRVFFAIIECVRGISVLADFFGRWSSS